jgi:hypothetical protein
LQNEKCKMRIGRSRQFAICILQFAFCNCAGRQRRRFKHSAAFATLKSNHRRGSVYLAVLGTGLIVSLLALSALALQRLQNRMLSASADVRQAQLNAEAAIELGLLRFKTDPNWRGTENANLDAGSYTLTAVDPPGDTTGTIVMTGVGSAGKAVQRVVRTVDSHVEPLSCLYSSIAAGGALSVSGGSTVLRATNSGLITANSTSSTSSTIYGQVQALTVTGSAYGGTTQQVAAADRPEMPVWATLFNSYRTGGTEIPISSLPTRSLNLARNVSITSGTVQWDADPPGLPASTITAMANTLGHAFCLSIVRSDKRCGVANRLAAGLLKPGSSYEINIEVHPNLSAFSPQNTFKVFLLTEYADGSYAESAGSYTTLTLLNNSWTPLSATVTTPNWATHPTAVYAVVNSDSALPPGTSRDFYVDNIDVYQTGAHFISQRVFGRGVNPFGTLNPNGVYWINCGGNKLILERSRINGTLVLSNLGSGSCIDYGPIQLSPATTGYPVLLVEGDFSLQATNRTLNEAENSSDYDGLVTSYNPTGVAYDFGSSSVSSTNSTATDSYPSEIQGLVAVSGNLSFKNYTMVRGQIIVGGDVTASSGSLEVVYQPDALFSPPPGFTATPSQVGRPVSIRKAVLP